MAHHAQAAVIPAAQLWSAGDTQTAAAEWLANLHTLATLLAEPKLTQLDAFLAANPTQTIPIFDTILSHQQAQGVESVPIFDQNGDDAIDSAFKSRLRDLADKIATARTRIAELQQHTASAAIEKHRLQHAKSAINTDLAARTTAVHQLIAQLHSDAAKLHNTVRQSNPENPANKIFGFNDTVIGRELPVTPAFRTHLSKAPQTSGGGGTAGAAGAPPLPTGLSLPDITAFFETNLQPTTLRHYTL